MSDRAMEKIEKLIKTLEALAAVQSARQTYVNKEVQLVVAALMDELKLKK